MNFRNRLDRLARALNQRALNQCSRGATDFKRRLEQMTDKELDEFIAKRDRQLGIDTKSLTEDQYWRFFHAVDDDVGAQELSADEYERRYVALYWQIKGPKA